MPHEDEVSPIMAYGGGYGEETMGGAYDCTMQYVVIVLILILLWYYMIHLPKQQQGGAPSQGLPFISSLGLSSRY